MTQWQLPHMWPGAGVEQVLTQFVDLLHTLPDMSEMQTGRGLP